MSRTTIRIWYLIHKWSSLIPTAFLLMLCVSGLPLIFHDEIDAAIALDGGDSESRAQMEWLVTQVEGFEPGRGRP